MHRWYVIGLFERKKSPPEWDHGFVATWAVIDGPFTDLEWARARSNEVSSHNSIRIGEAKWNCVFSCVVKSYDLISYGLARQARGEKQLVLAGMVGEE